MRTEHTRQYVRDLVLAAYREVIGGEPPDGLDTEPGQVADWSSLAQVRLLHAIEQDLECALDERFLTVGSTLGELVDAACAASGVDAGGAAAAGVDAAGADAGGADISTVEEAPQAVNAVKYR